MSGGDNGSNVLIAAMVHAKSLRVFHAVLAAARNLLTDTQVGEDGRVRRWLLP